MTLKRQQTRVELSGAITHKSWENLKPKSTAYAANLTPFDART
jgi:hypothetical protein